MPNVLEISIVSDVVCPWCVVGKGNFDQALALLEQENSDIEVLINWLPFQLNPNMATEGENINDHLIHKYGLDEKQLEVNKSRLVEAGKAVGFDFNFNQRSRIYNTYKAHLMMTWASLLDNKTAENALNKALFLAYFSQGKDISNDQILLTLVAEVGLSAEVASEVLKGGELQQTVKAELDSNLKKVQQWGVQSVPTFIINQQYSISGGQPASVFKQALLDISKEVA